MRTRKFEKLQKHPVITEMLIRYQHVHKLTKNLKNRLNLVSHVKINLYLILIWGDYIWENLNWHFDTFMELPETDAVAIVINITTISIH